MSDLLHFLQIKTSHITYWSSGNMSHSCFECDKQNMFLWFILHKIPRLNPTFCNYLSENTFRNSYVPPTCQIIFAAYFPLRMVAQTVNVSSLSCASLTLHHWSSFGENSNEIFFLCRAIISICIVAFVAISVLNISNEKKILCFV